MEETRQKARTRFSERVFDGDDVLARRLERSVYNYAVRSSRKDHIPQHWENQLFRHRYINMVLHMVFNLTHPENPALRQHVISGDIPFERLPYMESYVLFPAHWEEVFERVAAKQLRKQLTHDIDSVPDGAFQCSKCKSKKTTYVELQTRSADEPATLYIQCMNCQKRWKQ